MMNRKKTGFLIFLLIAPLLVCVPAARADEKDNSAESFRCGGKIVEIGDPKYVVKTKCGEPSAKQELGNIWVYDFGPEQFVY